MAGYVEGQRISFIHPEVSDKKVAGLLTEMLNSPVIVVSSLAQAPEPMLADVYVFTNGIKGGGPFGFQVDVFDAVPGQARYTPLRSVILVAWQGGAKPRLLGSVEEIQAATRKGDVTLKRPGVVVNMPMLAWPGGRR